MTWLTDLLADLFPYRRHLREEIEYLKAQCAQKQRRIDELQERLLKQLDPKPKEIRIAPKPIPVKGKGFEAHKAWERLHAKPEEESDARGKDKASGAGVEADEAGSPQTSGSGN